MLHARQQGLQYVLFAGNFLRRNEISRELTVLSYSLYNCRFHTHKSLNFPNSFAIISQIISFAFAASGQTDSGF